MVKEYLDEQMIRLFDPKRVYRCSCGRERHFCPYHSEEI
jgi:hypothetical protein